ncbi:hypothetical protein EW145_g206 [Phellinidium pouzarii]|uniref:Rab-GAP TBC domain-containing protein n=1 Tax=Phellinidium pouzarii TaxID=167371 RepID=A0A4V6S1C5_9AGAM|nr:hypothetical protein EW145_g206 [Phellinidium pouzarii]
MEEKAAENLKEKYDDFNLGDGDVSDAVRRRDWSRLRVLSTRAGGFGEERNSAWPFLLHAQQKTSGPRDSDSDRAHTKLRKRRKKIASVEGVRGGHFEKGYERDALRSSSAEEHPDERQIKLDTDRSFVLYPNVSVEDHRDREELQTELNGLITTIFRRHTKLNYFQGYHDVISVLFLTLSEDQKLPCADKMSLHRLRDAMGKGLEPLIGLLQILKYLLRLADPEYAVLLERNTPLPYFALSNLLTLFSHDIPTLPLIQHIFDFLLSRPPIAVVYLAAAFTLARKNEATKMEEEGEEGMLHSLLSNLPELSDGDEHQNDEELKIEASDDGRILKADILVEKQKHALEDEVTVKVEECNYNGPGKRADVLSENGLTVHDTIEDGGSESKDQRKIVESPDSSDLQPSAAVPSNEVPQEMPFEQKLSLGTETPPATTAMQSTELSDLPSSGFEAPSESETNSRPASSLSHVRPPKLSLPYLLEHADILFALYPPSQPSLHISSIIGPQSVILTWSEDPRDMASDAEAEAMMTHPELVTLEFVDLDETPVGEDPDAHSGRRHRKLRKRYTKHFGVSLDKKTVLTGAVVALGVAIAVYSMRAKGGHSGMDITRTQKGLRRVGKWITAIFIRD